MPQCQPYRPTAIWTDCITVTKSEKAACTIKTVNDGGRSKTSVLGCSEVIFRDAENVGRAAIAPENLAPP